MHRHASTAQTIKVEVLISSRAPPNRALNKWAYPVACGGVSLCSSDLFVLLSSQWTAVGLKVVRREVNSGWS